MAAQGYKIDNLDPFSGCVNSSNNKGPAGQPSNDFNAKRFMGLNVSRSLWVRSLWPSRQHFCRLFRFVFCYYLNLCDCLMLRCSYLGILDDFVMPGPIPIPMY